MRYAGGVTVRVPRKELVMCENRCSGTFVSRRWRPRLERAVRRTVYGLALGMLWGVSGVTGTAEDWLQFQFDARRSGDAAQRSVSTPLGLVAAVPLSDAIFTAPAVADGRVYVVDGAGTAWCLDAATLQTIWTRRRQAARPTAITSRRLPSPATICISAPWPARTTCWTARTDAWSGRSPATSRSSPRRRSPTAAFTLPRSARRSTRSRRTARSPGRGISSAR